MKPFEYTPEQLFLEFRTSQNGLHVSEVQKRQKEFGKNIIEANKKKNYLKLLKK